ncbi:hypothetical protein [Chryseobacterium aquaticum]|uniref:HNH domain-containing protein n=1 Tax=Chryseobacterium aquaticum subsp. greenlandense TaxID=345663 RepID=A0A101CI50_9FLAO|nr:hypothetical protein [Chryseobacterium aquaticum]KUJ56440.1 hypothetical protein AR686_07715 [Chryseobacterium aquaticum subsp. greenlandense]
MPCDYSKYPPNWKTEIRPRILERANNCCEQCKVSNYELIERGKFNNVFAYQNMNGKIFCAETGDYLGENYLGSLKDAKLTKVILTIAHLDHDKENWEVKDERLKALCQRCHLVLDKNHHAENRRETLNKKKGLESLF